MSGKRNLTASTLDRAAQCPGSFTLPHRFRSTPQMRHGTDEHKRIHAEVESGGDTALSDFCNPEGDLYLEKPVRWEDIGGRADAISVEPSLVRITDWKTGSGEVESLQLKLYALAAAEKHGKARAIVQIGEIGGESPVLKSAEVDLEQSAARIREVKAAVERARAGEPVFNAGEHCNRCPAFDYCPLDK